MMTNSAFIFHDFTSHHPSKQKLNSSPVLLSLTPNFQLASHQTKTRIRPNTFPVNENIDQVAEFIAAPFGEGHTALLLEGVRGAGSCGAYWANVLLDVCLIHFIIHFA